MRPHISTNWCKHQPNHVKQSADVLVWPRRKVTVFSLFFFFFRRIYDQDPCSPHQNKVCACRMHPNVYTGHSLILCKTERPAEYIYLIIYNISWKKKSGNSWQFHEITKLPIHCWPSIIPFTSHWCPIIPIVSQYCWCYSHSDPIIRTIPIKSEQSFMDISPDSSPVSVFVFPYARHIPWISSGKLRVAIQNCHRNRWFTL